MTAAAESSVSHYERECKHLCPFCAQGIAQRPSVISGNEHVMVTGDLSNNKPFAPCLAPTIEQFAQAQAQKALVLEMAVAGVRTILSSPFAETRPVAAIKDAVERLRQAMGK